MATDGIIHIHNRLAVALCPASEAKNATWAGSEKLHFFTASDCLDENLSIFDPVSIESINNFTAKMHRYLFNFPGMKIVACVGKNDAKLLTRTALLLGGFMILGQGLGFEEVSLSFSSIRSRFLTFPDASGAEEITITVDDCLRTLCRAKCLGWIDLTHNIDPAHSSPDVGSFPVDEFAHYARPENGAVFRAVPGALLLFPTPIDLPHGELWHDEARGVRHFSAAYFADLFADLGVGRVLCPAATAGRGGVRAAFAARGIPVDVLCAAAPAPGAADDAAAASDSDAALAAANRLLEYSAHAEAPGGVAVCVGGGGCGGGDSGLAGLLAAAVMVGQFGFEPTWAAAWVRMLHPSLLSARHGRLLATLRAVPAAPRPAVRRRSGPAAASAAAEATGAGAAARTGKAADVTSDSDCHGGPGAGRSSSAPGWFFGRAASAAADLFGRVGSAGSVPAEILGARIC